MNLNEIGKHTISLKRITISKEIILDFATLTGDKNEVHMDDRYAIVHGFRSLIAHRMLTLSFINGLMYESGLYNGTTVIFTHLHSVKFIKPAYPNTEIFAQLNVTEKCASRDGKGTYIVVQVIGIEAKTNSEFISFEAKFKILQENIKAEGKSDDFDR